jgi:hypothetical protein
MFNNYIKSETLAEKIVDVDGSNLRHRQEFDLNGAKTVIALEPVS